MSARHQFLRISLDEGNSVKPLGQAISMEAAEEMEDIKSGKLAGLPPWNWYSESREQKAVLSSQFSVLSRTGWT